ncbi:NAD(P)-dependent oxidoreductase [Verminephrobacter aporrectodeae subsp. tuberculatae]|uniref:L-threonate dehydrogenase n=1 Tax=Verminephrobacter aporrectodeae TaxID=1110389 RepID=UPI002236FAA3|nr:L-threonate dehydrogenase [Verminephrobacter aporrectodeae]MCW5223229.1 NAD(P)-dependent oxidoreductase [Verminephrobacter aporrectodeae subsp. tuberculatae]MCW5288693.1 NAD(P)-dependent oxidoreductase [Verminephrobacter aporrectodeae subsp. tuberculatae]
MALQAGACARIPGESVRPVVKKVGIIGLGAMGAGIARTLRANGYEVHACDLRPGAAAAFAAQGGVACGTPAEVAAACEVLVSVVVDAAQTESVLFGAGGAAAAMKPESTFIMCSTVDPNWSVALEERLGQVGIHYIDAPISGGAAKAAAGQMTVMSSARPQAYARAGAVLEAMAGKVYRLGERAGVGSQVKIINQLLAGVHIAAAAEAMALGLRAGVDAAALYEVITHSAGNSWMFENRMAHVLAADYTPLSAVDIFVKDLGLVLDTARASKFPLPLASTAHQMFMQASTAGFAKEDDSAVIKIFPGIELPKAQATDAGNFSGTVPTGPDA